VFYKGEYGLKRFKKLGVVLVIILILSSASVIISMDKFNTPNPIKSGIGIAKIMLTDAKIVQIQKYPQVYLAKPNNAQQTLINFMEQRGYKYLENERMASTLVFGNEISKNYIEFSVNDYYSKWVFRE